MKHTRTIRILIMAVAIILGMGAVSVHAQETGARAAVFPSETNPFVSNFYIDPTNQDAPFFEEILPQIAANIKENNKHSISPYYDNFPLANNPENFQGLGHTTYANINGKTVTAEAFYRVHNESLCDPNAGMGLMIYQCIQYKLAHPEEDVSITFSSYRTSVTASVCVLPESKYYGYMRSLYGTNYDEHGFVRISYMLVEAARMGIKVTLVNQLPSYSVQQYNPSTGKLKSRSHINFETYYNRALATDCYDSYAPGKKVSDFMNFVKVDWKVGDKTGDMQHVKSATVSHYLATDGTEHRSAVFFCSANLDENNYIGANGNNGAQSGVIVSDHDELYRVTVNYMNLMAKYKGQEDMYLLRDYMYHANREQAELIRAGRGNEIPKDEQIIYLGSKSDKIFELYFTPFGTSADVWDTENDPTVRYWDKLAQSTGYIELFWNEFGFGSDFKCNMTQKMIEKAFCENKNPNNKISLRIDEINTDAIKALKLGTEIGARSIQSGKNIHSKDILLSYEENGIRHRVSMITSCNYYTVAFNYRTNSMLVIHESDETDGNYYEILAKKYSYGMLDDKLRVDSTNLALEVGESYTVDVDYTGSNALSWSISDPAVATVSGGTIQPLKEGTATITVTDGNERENIYLTVAECAACAIKQGGLTGSTDEQYVIGQKLGAVPLTFEAVFTVNQESLMRTTTLLGNDGYFDQTIVFSMNKSGQPRVQIRNTTGYDNDAVYVFDKVNVATGEKVHLTFAIDRENLKMHCYVNGEKVQSSGKMASMEGLVEVLPFVVSGDHKGGNRNYLPGELESLAVWSDYRTAEEIESDYLQGIDTADKNLLAAYDFTKCDNCMRKDLSGNGKDLVYEKLWQEKSEVAPVGNYAYSFAVVGDTQIMCERDPEAMKSIYQWILDNRKSQKIEYVIGLGDITNNSTDEEWENALPILNLLNGKIPYVLTRGNHDDWDDFNRNLHNGFYETTVEGMMVSGDVELTDPAQPGLVEVVLPDGSVVIQTREEDQPEGGTVQGDLTNSYRTFRVADTDYLILTLDFAPNSEMLEWANSVIESHPKHRVIVVTHAYLYRDGTTLDAEDRFPATYFEGYDDAQNGDDIWEKCISKHENVVMVLSGHDPTQHVIYRQDKGENGNTVTQFLIDAQDMDNLSGSMGMVAMFYFSEDGNTLTVRYYSVTKGCYGSERSNFTVKLD